MLSLYRKLLRYSFGISNNNTKQIVLQDVRHLFRDKLKNVKDERAMEEFLKSKKET